jgi:hypothetical protein
MGRSLSGAVLAGLLGAFLTAAGSSAGSVMNSATGPPAQRTLSGDQRNALLALVSAVDAAAAGSGVTDSDFTWENHVLKSVSQTAFVPLRVRPPEALRSTKSLLMYVRAVTRHDGIRSKEERSFVRDWLLKAAEAPAVRHETVYLPVGEMPVGGPATSSSRPAMQAAAEATARLAIQAREFERETAEAESAKKKLEVKQRDPYRFAFEEYYVVAGSQPLERAIALPAGEYDVYVALADHAHLKTTSPVISRRTLTIPDFWNDELAIGGLILAREVRTLNAPLSVEQQAAHPYTFGRAEVIPVNSPEFTTRDALSLVIQICNYGAPDTDLAANYVFYSLDGERRQFNRTAPQLLTEADLPRPPSAWDTQAFTMQSVSLQPFPPGRYEVEVSIRDNLTRAIAKASTTFTVK